jgi:hypothetical protein
MSEFSEAEKVLNFTLLPRSWVVFKANKEFEPTSKLKIVLNKPFEDLRTRDLLISLTAKIEGTDFNEVTFAVREKGKSWNIVGTSDHRVLGANGLDDGLYRVYLRPSKYKKGTKLEVVAIGQNTRGEKLASGIQSYLIK